MPIKICINANIEPFCADVVFPKGVPEGGHLTLSVGKHTQRGSIKGKIFIRQELSNTDSSNYACFIRPISDEDSTSKPKTRGRKPTIEKELPTPQKEASKNEKSPSRSEKISAKLERAPSRPERASSRLERTPSRTERVSLRSDKSLTRPVSPQPDKAFLKSDKVSKRSDRSLSKSDVSFDSIEEPSPEPAKVTPKPPIKLILKPKKGVVLKPTRDIPKPRKPLVPQNIRIQVPLKKSLMKQQNAKPLQDPFKVPESPGTLRIQSILQEAANESKQQDIFRVPESPNTLRIQTLLQEAVMEAKKDENARSSATEGIKPKLPQNVTIQIPIKHSIKHRVRASESKVLTELTDNIFDSPGRRPKRRTVASLPKNAYAENNSFKKAAAVGGDSDSNDFSDAGCGGGFDNDDDSDTDTGAPDSDLEDDPSLYAGIPGEPTPQHPCPFCEVVEIDEHRLDYHKRTCHADKAPFKCDICEKMFFKDSLYRKHVEICCKVRRNRELKRKQEAARDEARKLQKSPPQARKAKVVPFSCDVCNEFFNDYDSLMSHILGNHPGHELFACVECKKAFAHTVFLLSHQATHEKEKEPKGDWNRCKLCPRTFSTLKKLHGHLLSHSTVKLYKCNQCDARFAVKANLAQHLKTHDTSKLHTCDQCGKSFPTYSRCKRHISRIHVRDFKNECRFCKRKYQDRNRLLVHLGMAHFNQLTSEEVDGLKDKLLQCEDCNFKTYSKKSFRLHSARHRGDYPFQCQQCSAKFAFNFSLKHHIRVTHKNEGGQCPHCPRVFMAQETFNNHVAMHNNKTGYTCEKCNKMYETQRLYNKHCSECKEAGSFVCDICNMSLPSRNTLYSHRVFHNTGASPKEPSLSRRKESNHQCEVCFSWFKFKSSLIAHQMFVHDRNKDETGRPSCNICHKSFRSMMVLSTHIRDHIGERPYKCPHCSKSFKQYLTKRNHITYFHTKKFKVYCPLCKKGLINNTKLRSHLKLGHKAMEVNNKPPGMPAVEKRPRQPKKPPQHPPPPPPPSTSEHLVPPIATSRPVSHLAEMMPMTSTTSVVHHAPHDPHHGPHGPHHPPHHYHPPAHVGEMDSAVNSLISAMTYEAVPYHEEVVQYNQQMYRSQNHTSL